MKETTYKIWYWRYDPVTKKYEQGCRTKEYIRYGNAINAARKIFKKTGYGWIVSITNPFIKKCDHCGKEIHVDNPFRDFLSASRLNLRIVSPDRATPDVYSLTLCYECALKMAKILPLEVSND